MKDEIALAEWSNAVEGYESAEILHRHGKYKRAVSEAYYAMEAAARASLATKGIEPKTRTGVWKALTNKLVRSGEISAEAADYLAKERLKRAQSEYMPLTEGAETEAREGCERARSVLTTTRTYLLSKGYKEEDLPQPDRHGDGLLAGAMLTGFLERLENATGGHTERPPREIVFKERNDGRFDVNLREIETGSTKTLTSTDSILAGLSWLVHEKLIAEEEIPRLERNLLEDLERNRERERGR